MEHWTHTIFFSFPRGRSSKVVHSLLEQSWVSLGEGLMQIKLLFLSVSMPLLLALCCLGYWNFLIGVWNSQKGILVHILSLNQCFCGAKQGLGLLILSSCQYHSSVSLNWDNLCEVLTIFLICSMCPIYSIGYYYYHNHLLLYRTFILFTEHIMLLCLILYLLPGMAFSSFSAQWTST